MTRRVRRAIAALLLALVALFALPSSPVSAHASLVQSDPAANSVVATSPTSVVLTYDENIEASTASISLFDAKGAKISIGAPKSGASAAVVQATVPTLKDGIYAVVWRVTSEDGHVVDGAFSFQVGTASTGGGQDLVDQVLNGARVPTATAWWYGVARFLSLMGATLLIGTGMWGMQGDPRLDAQRGVRRAVLVGCIAFVVGSLACFGLFGASVKAGGIADAFKPSVWGDIASTHTGRMLLMRIAMSLVLAVLLSLRRHDRLDVWGAAAVTAAIVAIFSFSASGHPNALRPKTLWITLDAIHLGAITVWVGGLIALALATKAWFLEPRALLVVKSFSMVALVSVPVIIATGVAQSLKLAGGLHDISATTWGRFLLGKVMLVVAMIAVAGVTRWLLHHDGVASIRRTVMAEAVIGVLVVGLAAGMVAQAPRASAPSRPYNEQVTADGVIAAVTISPGHVGSNEVHIVVTPPGGSITPVAGVSGRVLLPSANLPAAPITLQQIGPNHYSGTVTIPRSGEWTLELIVSTTISDSVLLKGTVQIP